MGGEPGFGVAVAVERRDARELTRCAIRVELLVRE
jgi:hypothetical protein